MGYLVPLVSCYRWHRQSRRCLKNWFRGRKFGAIFEDLALNIKLEEAPTIHLALGQPCRNCEFGFSSHFFLLPTNLNPMPVRRTDDVLFPSFSLVMSQYLTSDMRLPSYRTSYLLRFHPYPRVKLSNREMMVSHASL